MNLKTMGLEARFSIEIKNNNNNKHLTTHYYSNANEISTLLKISKMYYCLLF